FGDVDSLQVGLLAVATCLVLAARSEGGSSLTALGSQGFLSAMVAALISVAAYRLFRRGGLLLLSPAGSPPRLATAVAAITPLATLLGGAWVVSVILGVHLAELPP